ncbi:MAG: alpha/beta hydrolase [Acidimicrobiales bacterium]|jgi:acetyl esterase/lipase|nr:alpha/beta hydrolase [Acidimicrobiales bacterium]
MAALVHLVLAVLASVHVVSGLVRLRRPAAFGFPLMLAGLIAAELTRWFALLLLVGSGVFLALGTADTSLGQVAFALTGASLLGLVALEIRGRRAGRVVAPIVADLPPALPHPARAPSPWRPVRFTSDRIEVHRDLPYGDHERHRLDVWRPKDADGTAPVLLQIHGGAWVSGSKDTQGRPLMKHLAERGWVCVAVNYRLAPRQGRWPAQLVDVKRAIAWLREHVHEHGGDPAWLAVTGGSAGGHLTALAALTAQRPEYQPGFEDADTSIQAAVPFYGVFDFADRFGIRGGRGMRPFLERMVMPTRFRDDPTGWDDASPLAVVCEAAPPMLVVHGTHDLLAPVEEARAFVTAMRAVSTDEVRYLELPGAQHAFDIVESPRTIAVVDGVTRFLEAVHARRLPVG